MSIDLPSFITGFSIGGPVVAVFALLVANWWRDHVQQREHDRDMDRREADRRDRALARGVHLDETYSDGTVSTGFRLNPPSNNVSIEESTDAEQA